MRTAINGCCLADFDVLQPDARILRYVVLLPVRIYTEAALDIGQEVWTWIADARPDLEPRVVSLVLEAWSEALNRRHGLSNQTLRSVTMLRSYTMPSLTDIGIYSSESPLDQETKYTPTDKEGLMRDYLLANRVFGPMLSMLNFMQSRFQAFRYRSSRLVLLSIRFVLKSLRRQALWRFVFDQTVYEAIAGSKLTPLLSTHPVSRELRLRFIAFGFCLLQGTRLESATEYSLRSELYNAAFGWFSVKPT